MEPLVYNSAALRRANEELDRRVSALPAEMNHVKDDMVIRILTANDVTLTWPPSARI